MVLLSLYLLAEIDGVTDLRPVDAPSTPFEYTFIIQCTSCREEHYKPVTINRFESHEVTGSRGEASFVFKCRQCKKEHSASISRTTNTYKVENRKKKVPLLTIDSRGLEFLDFIPEGNFEARGVDSKTVFNTIDLSQGEWYDYDEKSELEVSVTDLFWTIERS